MASSTTSESKDIGSVFDLLGRSADIVKKNWKMFLVVNIFTILFTIGTSPQYMSDSDSNSSETPWGTTFDFLDGVAVAAIVAGVVVVALLSLFFYAMTISLSVKASQGKSPQFSELATDGKKYMLRILGLSILTVIIVAIGFILLILPGIIAIKRLIYAPYMLVNENLGVTAALKRSNELSKTHSDRTWALIGLAILVAIITGVLTVIPVFGVIASMVLSIAWSLIYPLRYLQLKSL